MFFKEDARSVGTADYNTSTKKPTLPITHDGRAPGVHWFIGSLVSLGSTDVGPENSFVLGSTKLLINYFSFSTGLTRTSLGLYFARPRTSLELLSASTASTASTAPTAIRITTLRFFFGSIIRPFATLRSAKYKRARASEQAAAPGWLGP